MDRGAIEAFFLGWLRAGSIAVEPDDSGVYLVQLPGDERARQLTFDPEAAEEGAERELITFGSPLLDRAMQQTLAAGRVVRLYAPRRDPEPGPIAQRLRESLGFDRVRCLGTSTGRLVETRVFRFDFVLTVHGDVVQQLSASVLIDAATCFPAPELAAEAIQLRMEETRQALLPCDSEAPPGRILLAAVNELKAQTAKRLEALSEELRNQGRRERKSVKAYFEELEEQHVQKIARARTPESKLKAEQTLAAIHAERDLRLRELEARFSPRVEARLGAVAVLHVPRYTAQLIVQRGERTLHLPMRYDVLTGIVTPPACPACGKPALVLIGRRDGDAIGCGACVPKPPEHVPAPPAPAAVPTPVAGRVARPASSQPVKRVAVKVGPPLLSENQSYRKAAERNRDLLRKSLRPTPVAIDASAFVFLVRAESRSARRMLTTDEPLPERLSRQVLAEIDRVTPVPGLVTTGGSDRAGRLLGTGASVFLIGQLIPVEDCFSGHRGRWNALLNDRLQGAHATGWDRTIQDRRLRRSTSLLGSLGGAEYHGVAWPMLTAGVPAEAESLYEALSDAADGIGEVLRRELGLTGAEDALWMLDHDDVPELIQDSWRAVVEAFSAWRFLAATPAPATIRARLEEAYFGYKPRQSPALPRSSGRK